MARRINLLALYTIGLLLLPIPPWRPPCHAQEFSLEQAQKAVVRVVTPTGHGVGIYIDRGLILTTFHNVHLLGKCNEHGEFAKREPVYINNQPCTVLVGETDGKAYLLDVALLKTEEENNSLELADEARIYPGKKVIVLGVSDIRGRDIRFYLKGEIVCTLSETSNITIGGESFFVDRCFFMLDITGFAGISGSPVVDADTGRVLGIIQRVLDDDAQIRRGYCLGTLVNKNLIQSLWAGPP